MSEDIVKRLREDRYVTQANGSRVLIGFATKLDKKAADEIERLRAELAAERKHAEDCDEAWTKLQIEHWQMRDTLRAELAAAKQAALEQSNLVSDLFKERDNLRADLAARDALLRAELAAAREDTSVARQSLYEVVEQRNHAMAELAAYNEQLSAIHVERANLRAELAAEREQSIMHFRAREADIQDISRLVKERDTLRADLAARDELLREAREYLVLADADGLSLLARIDAALAKD